MGPHTLDDNASAGPCGLSWLMSDMSNDGYISWFFDCFFAAVHAIMQPMGPCGPVRPRVRNGYAQLVPSEGQKRALYIELGLCGARPGSPIAVLRRAS